MHVITTLNMIILVASIVVTVLCVESACVEHVRTVRLLRVVIRMLVLFQPAHTVGVIDA